MKSTNGQQEDWSTNFGWWTDKPEKAARPSRARFSDNSAPIQTNVWRNAALVVGVMFALVLSMVSMLAKY